jgi:erythromycin esterase-like protein
MIPLQALPLFAQNATPAGPFADRAAKFHYQMEVKDGRLSGSGAPILVSALEDAQFVLLGEDHGIAQIPQFDAAICGVLGSKGFHDLAIEVGPSAAEELNQVLAEKDGRTRFVAFNKEFPETVAFYNWSGEYDFLASCSQSAAGGKSRLWGLDQELMGASRLLLTQILKQQLSPAAAAEGRHLLEENDAAQVQAAKTGNPFDLFMMSASDAELAHFRDTLVHEGNPGLPKMLDGILSGKQPTSTWQKTKTPVFST